MIGSDRAKGILYTSNVLTTIKIMAFYVENRNMNVKKEIIPECVNTNKDENNAIRAREERVEKISNQVNVENRSFKDALIRSN